MELTRDFLLQQLDEIRQQEAENRTNLIALSGARQTIQHMLEKLDEEEAQPPAGPPAEPPTEPPG